MMDKKIPFEFIKNKGKFFVWFLTFLFSIAFITYSKNQTDTFLLLLLVGFFAIALLIIISYKLKVRSINKELKASMENSSLLLDFQGRVWDKANMGRKARPLLQVTREGTYASTVEQLLQHESEIKELLLQHKEASISLAAKGYLVQP